MILQRLKTFIDYKGISTSRFEKSVGMSNAAFRNTLLSGGSIGSDKLEKIISVYPDLSPVWLLTGNGSMLADERATAANIPENYLEIICRQSEEIGRLREMVEQLERRLGNRVSSAPTFNTANVI